MLNSRKLQSDCKVNKFKAKLPSGDVLGTQALSDKSVQCQNKVAKEPLENIMLKLNEVLLEDQPCHAIKSPEAMFHLAVTLHEVINYRARNTVDAKEREKQDELK
ncbi:hypothetical protein OTU49_012801 [Cherax quadricarinatus]|uniref:Uncharacterized protein n=1 Tax=Cherax quadricarinatus TaxID=27406 RepID=A0AAW0VWC2_CHEQU